MIEGIPFSFLNFATLRLTTPQGELTRRQFREGLSPFLRMSVARTEEDR
jgi:hypothetical protein